MARIFNEKTIMHYLSRSTADKSGFLLKKRSENKRSFKKRYFVLSANLLVYSEHNTDKEPLGVIFLEGHSVELVDDCIFAIRFNGFSDCERSYILKADTDIAAVSWMQALSHCGSEFLLLSVEELEDQWRAVNTSTGSRIASPGLLNSSQSSSNRNPFNNNSPNKEVLPQDRLKHLLNLFSLSWDDLQSITRSYFDAETET